MVSTRRAAALAALLLPELALALAWAGGASRFLVALAQLVLLLGYAIVAAAVSWRAARQTYLQNLHQNAALAERSRLAAEMHDLLGHRLALLALKAGALQLQTHGAARQTAAELRAGVDSAITELADTITVLGETHPSGPAAVPGLSALLTRARAAGMSITLDGGLDHQLPVAVRQAALGVVREGLTNAARHAPDEPVTLHAAVHDDVLTVQLDNPLSTQPSTGGSGTGVATLRRRIEALGGHLDHARDNDRFTLTATLPLTAPVPATPATQALPSPLAIIIRRAWAPVLGVAAAVLGFHLWASIGATLEPAEFAAIRVGQPVPTLPPREAPVRLLPTPPAPSRSDCSQYTDASFPLAYATFQICVNAGTVTSTTDLRQEDPW